MDIASFQRKVRLVELDERRIDIVGKINRHFSRSSEVYIFQDTDLFFMTELEEYLESNNNIVVRIKETLYIHRYLKPLNTYLKLNKLI